MKLFYKSMWVLSITACFLIYLGFLYGLCLLGLEAFSLADGGSLKRIIHHNIHERGWQVFLFVLSFLIFKGNVLGTCEKIRVKIRNIF